ncbi:unnamed protein product [Urochloa humidicola]
MLGPPSLSSTPPEEFPPSRRRPLAPPPSPTREGSRERARHGGALAWNRLLACAHCRGLLVRSVATFSAGRPSVDCLCGGWFLSSTRDKLVLVSAAGDLRRENVVESRRTYEPCPDRLSSRQ